jgi:hypothetical protein
MPYIKSIILLIVLSTFCQAEVKAVIDGPAKAFPGDLVVLSGNKSVGDGFRWITPDRIQTITVGCNTENQIAFATSRAGTYEFILIVADKEATIDYVKHTIVIGTSTYPIDPPPEEPVPPNTNFDRFKVVSSNASKVLNDPTTTAELKKAITSTLLTLNNSDMATATTAIRLAIDNVFEKRVGESRSKDWLSWRIAVNKELKDIANVNDYRKAILAVSEGL